MKNIVIIGASGLAKEVWDLINHINQVEERWKILGFYDDAYLEPVNIIGNLQCHGPISILNDVEEELSLVFAIANRESVSSIYQKLSKKQNFSFPNIIHPSVLVGYGTKIGIGNVITSQNIFTVDITIGDFNFFNTMCGIGHDVTIGDFNTFMPRVQISGNVQIGDFNNFFMNSSVTQNKTIGNKNTIFANTLLTKSIKHKRTYFGIPGRKISI